MRTSKAIAGGLAAGPVAALVMHVLLLIPAVAGLTSDMQATLQLVISTVVGYLGVYHAPANTSV